jgi:hypothetical protein
MKFVLMITLGLMGGIAGRADTILYDYRTTLSLNSGTDTLGLNGAVLNLEVDVSSSAVYSTQFGFPAVVMNDDASVTISGSSDAADNGTFDLPLLTFYPFYEGYVANLFTASGNQVVLSLPVGGTLLLDLSTEPTSTGSTEQSGDTVKLTDFGPTVSDDGKFYGSNGNTYAQIDPTVSATIVSSAPEPNGLALVLTGLCGLAGLSRSRRP